MTRDKDFKTLVRARMRRTGENYTAARAVLASLPSGAGEVAQQQQRLVQRWFDGPRLHAVPARRKVRIAVLLEVLTRFSPREVLSEPEVNARLRPVHPDVAYLRRELVAAGYLRRAGGTYAVAEVAPERDARQRRELPEWERVWLPGFLTGRGEDTR